MSHRVGQYATIEYDSENQEWVGHVDYDGGEQVTVTSVELSQVVFDLSEMGAIEPESYEWANRHGIEQVLVVVPESEER